MDKNKLRQLLETVKTGDTSVDDAVESLKRMPFDDLGFAKLDTHRELRRGFPEVIFCMGKTLDQIKKIITHFADGERRVMATKATPEIYEAIKSVAPGAKYFAEGEVVMVGPEPENKTERIIAVVTAGTSDIPVAEEAAITAELMGNPVNRLYDVGVAGVHRLLYNKDVLFEASVIIVVAGMEGALASVVGGLVECPVIAVPTSIGYGASFNGLAALLSMLNSCSPGVAVMNIDNGFGAGYFAAITNLSSEK